MDKYINKTNIILIVIMFITLRLMDFNQTMTSMWVGPVLSAAVNFDITNWNMYINWSEVKEFSHLTTSEMINYNFYKVNDLILYDYLAKGLVLLVVIAKKIFFFLGDLEALQYLQYLVHIIISIMTLSLLKYKYQKIFFFLLGYEEE